MARVNWVLRPVQNSIYPCHTARLFRSDLYPQAEFREVRGKIDKRRTHSIACPRRRLSLTVFPMPKSAKSSARVKKAALKNPSLTVTESREMKRYREIIPQMEKRDGRIVSFDFEKIVSAIHKAMLAAEEGSYEDAVETKLMLNDFIATAKSYILYRDKRNQMRAEQIDIPEEVRKLADESKSYFKNNALGEFVYLRSYSKWIPEGGRRETWIETVDRYLSFMKENIGNKLSSKEYTELRDAILNQQVMPSMRLMQFAGEAVRRCNVAAYNCSYIAPSKIKDFAEIMYISMCGTGVGYSVESANVQALPQIEFQTGEKLPTHVVGDSKEGWCTALTLGLTTWYEGKDIDFDFSQVRPAGA